MKIHKRLIDLESPAEVVKQIVSCTELGEETRKADRAAACVRQHRPPCPSSPVSRLRSRSPLKCVLDRSDASWARRCRPSLAECVCWVVVLRRVAL